MNSRRRSLVLALLCSLLFVPVCRAGEPRTLEDALLNYTWTWERPSLVNTWTKVKFLSDGRFVGVEGRGNWAKVTTTWSKVGPNSVLVAGNKTLVFDQGFRSYTGSNPEKTDVITGTRVEPQLPITPTTTLSLDPNQPLLESLSQLAPNASAWVLAGLDEGVPPNVRQNLTYIREDLLDEYKQKPKASQEAYKLAHQLCSTMITALDERDQTLVRAGFRAVQADAGISGTNKALEARRNYMMSWPQYAREQAQRAELIRQGTAGAQVNKALPKVEWSTRTAALRKTLDDLYAKFREALRQSPPVK